MQKQTLLTFLLLTACNLVSASDAGASFLKCAQIKKSEMRLACYDKVARELAQNSSSQSGAESDHRLELNRLRERLRKERLARLEALATGTAKQSSLTEIYASKVVAAIRPNIIFTSVIAGNPTAEVEVTTLPNGEILSRKLVRSSGNSEWDTAVLRAIDRTQRLPKDEDGRAPSPIIIAFLPEK